MIGEYSSFFAASFLKNTVVIDEREIFCKLRDSCHSWQDALTVYNFNEFMSKESIRYWQHPKLMALVTQLFKEILLKRLVLILEICEQVKHDVHQWQNLYCILILVLLENEILYFVDVFQKLL